MYKQTLSLVALATLAASLEANTLQLDPIVISASKTEQSLKDVTANMDVITAQELEERHLTTVIDALKTLSNIPITQNGGMGQSSSFFLHGFSSDNTLVLIDGIRYNNPTTTKGQSQLEHLMINDIERIEIIKGAQSGVWGADAVAGVINIITRKASDELQANVNIEYGIYDTIKESVNISKKVGVLSYYIGVNQIQSNGFSAFTPKGKNPEKYEADSYKNQGFNAKIGYNITSLDTLNTEFHFIDTHTQYDGYDQMTYDPLPNSSGYDTHQINRLGSVSYSHKINPLDSITLNYSMATFNSIYPKDDLAYQGNNHELSLQGSYHYANDGFFVIGGNKQDSKDTIIARELDSKGLFLSNTNQVSNLIVTESIRHDVYSAFNDKTTGKIGVKYNFMKDISLSSNYGTGYRTPSLDELYGRLGANPKLQPEMSKSFDATFEYKHFSVTYYNNLVDNLIQYVYDPNTWIGQNTQVDGKSRLKGIELSYKNTIAQDMILDIGYNKLSAKNQEGNYLQRRPYDTFRSSLDYYGIDRFHMGIHANYIGTRYDDLAQTDQTGRYTLWGTTINYDVSNTMTLYVKGENLSDKRYQEVSGYGTAGRSMYIGLNAKF